MKESQSFLTVRSGHVSQCTECPHMTYSTFTLPCRNSLRKVHIFNKLQWGFFHKFNMKNCFATTEILLALLMLLLILCCGINLFDMLCFYEFSSKEKQVYFGGTVNLVFLQMKHKTFSKRVKFVSINYRIFFNLHSGSQKSKSTNTS